MNTITIAGVITSDIEVIATERNGRSLSHCPFEIIETEFTNKKVFNKYHCEAFGKAAEKIGQHFGNGKAIIIIGKLIQGDDGITVYVERVEFVPFNAKNEERYTKNSDGGNDILF